MSAESSNGSDRPVARLRDRYVNVVVPRLTERFAYRNRLQAPRITKIVLNMGLGEATQNSKVVDAANSLRRSPVKRPS